jgi:hypothetical protein
VEGLCLGETPLLIADVEREGVGKSVDQVEHEADGERVDDGVVRKSRLPRGRDVRGPLAKNGPKYLRWALIEAATHAARDAHYRERYERTKQRLGRQRGAKVARIDIARKLAEAIWHILTRNEPFAPAGPAIVLVA